MRTDRGSSIAAVTVLPGFFETLGISQLRGRPFTSADAAGPAPIAVVNESAAQVLFGTLDAPGRTATTQSGRVLEVVGVVTDVRMTIDAPPLPVVYTLPAGRSGAITLVVRMRGRSPTAVRDIRRAVGDLADDMPVAAGWWSDAIGSTTRFRTPRFQTVVLLTFSTLALLLTTLGVFSAGLFAVSRRTRELGIRFALGATYPSIVSIVLRSTMLPVVLGGVLGVAAGGALAKYAEAQMFGLAVGGPSMFVIGAAICAVAALAGSIIPARRAAMLDPVAVLRSE